MIGIEQDQAIRSQSQDRLGYAAFARSLARGILDRTNRSEGYVVSIEAPWGMGKTSAANLIVEAINEANSDEMSDVKRVHVLRFSPWPSQSLDAMAESYVSELGDALRRSFGHLVEDDSLTWARGLIGKFRGTAGPLAIAAATAAGANPTDAVLAGQMASTLADPLQSSPSRIGEELKKRLANLDAGQLIVIVDDIDRMPEDDIRKLFSLVKTFGDLPRVLHLLLFDRNIVESAYDAQRKITGQSYIDKVVQLSTTLPVVEAYMLRIILKERLQKLTLGIDEPRYNAGWLNALRHLIVNPRDIMRLSSALAVSWPSISDHADIIDFVVIEAMRIKHYNVWSKIRDNRHELTRPSYQGSENGEDSIFDLVLADYSGADKKKLKLLLQGIFPVPHGGGGNLSSLRSIRSIAVSQHVDVYFRLQPGATISRSTLPRLLRAKSKELLVRELRSLSSKEDVRGVLGDLSDRFDELIHDPSMLLAVLMDCGDDLIGRAVPDPPAMHDHEAFLMLDELTRECVSRIPLAERAQTIKAALEEAASISMPSVVWQRLALQSGYIGNRAPEDLGKMVSDNDVAQIGYQLLVRLRSRSMSELAGLPMLGWVLRIWESAIGVTGGVFNDAVDVAPVLAKSPLGLANIVDGLMGHAVSSRDGRIRSTDMIASVPGLTLQSLQVLARDALRSGDINREAPIETRGVAEAVIRTFAEAELPAASVS